MNNYVQYLEFINESKKIENLRNIGIGVHKNKTEYFPNSESLKRNIILKFQKLDKNEQKII